MQGHGVLRKIGGRARVKMGVREAAKFGLIPSHVSGFKDLPSREGSFGGGGEGRGSHTARGLSPRSALLRILAPS